jgi:protein-tyrosine phosphatase
VGLPWRAQSRGLALELGVNNVGPISAAAAARLAQLGIPLDGYLRLPRQVEEADLGGADLIIALKGDEHRPLLHSRAAVNRRVGAHAPTPLSR